MLKFKILVFVSLLPQLSFAQGIVNPKIAFGVTYSNVTSQRPAYEDINPFRRGWWATLEEDIEIRERFFIDIGLTYQERVHLEYFEFQGEPQVGVPFFTSFVDYPSNPQNEFFNELYNGEKFVHFPNFNYLHIETVPNISIGNKVKLSVGVGLFGGILINRNEVTRETSDFVFPKEFFEINGINHGIEYYRYDLGWIPKVDFQYAINEKSSVGVQLKSYHSLLRLNDTLVDTTVRVFNLFWVAYSGGITFQYRIERGTNNEK